RWYVVRSKARKEDYAVRQLERRGVQVFLPRILEWGRDEVAPLFPGYLFVCIALLEQYYRVVWTPGVRSFVAFGATPTPLPDSAGIGGAMNTGMHLRMRTVRLLGRALGAAALALALAACGHRAPASSAVMLPALQPPAPPEPGPTYRIQLGDELHVRFTFQPEMNEQVPVRPDGRISLVSTGEIDAVGHTPPELERVIVERSSGHL